MPDEDLLSAHAEIPDRVTFAKFLVALAEDLRTRPQGWERTDLEEYLRTMAWWLTNGLDAFSRNIRKKSPPDPPDWRLFADVMAAARVIE